MREEKGFLGMIDFGRRRSNRSSLFKSYRAGSGVEGVSHRQRCHKMFQKRMCAFIFKKQTNRIGCEKVRSCDYQAADVVSSPEFAR